MRELDQAKAVVKFIEMSHEERAQLLRRACDSKGVTAYRLSKDMQLKNAQECYVYLNKGTFGHKKMIKIADALGLTVQEFLNS